MILDNAGNVSYVSLDAPGLLLQRFIPHVSGSK